jgi:hypothetical protein
MNQIRYTYGTKPDIAVVLISDGHRELVNGWVHA